MSERGRILHVRFDRARARKALSTLQGSLALLAANRTWTSFTFVVPLGRLATFP